VAGEDVVLEVNDRCHLAVCTAVYLVNLHMSQPEF
jgi:hypothetical protein